VIIIICRQLVAQLSALTMGGSTETGGNSWKWCH